MRIISNDGKSRYFYLLEVQPCPHRDPDEMALLHTGLNFSRGELIYLLNPLDCSSVICDAVTLCTKVLRGRAQSLRDLGGQRETPTFTLRNTWYEPGLALNGAVPWCKDMSERGLTDTSIAHSDLGAGYLPTRMGRWALLYLWPAVRNMRSPSWRPERLTIVVPCRTREPCESCCMQCSDRTECPGVALQAGELCKVFGSLIYASSAPFHYIASTPSWRKYLSAIRRYELVHFIATRDKTAENWDELMCSGSPVLLA